MATDKEQGGQSRRDFLKVAGTAAAASLVSGLAAEAEARPEAAKPAPAAGGEKIAGGIPTPKADNAKLFAGKFPKAAVMAPGRVIGANDRVIVAFVGTGGMGGAQVGHFTAHGQEWNTQIGGICDVFQPRRDGHANDVKKANAQSASFVADADYRRLLENKDIDAVVIATPEHWHAQVACHAMEAGKHVYVQKPMTRYLDEAFQLHDTAARTKRVVQVGSQGCSNMIYHVAGKAIREGKLGRIVMGQGSYTRRLAYSDKRPPAGEWNYGIPGDCNPKTLDWDKWVGSSRDIEWKEVLGGSPEGEQMMRQDPAARFARFRKYREYSAGILSDLMPHKLHPFLIASGNPEFPTRVTCLGTKHGQDRDVNDSVQVLAEFPSGWTMIFIGSTVNEQGLQDMIRCEKGNIYFGNGVEVKPEPGYVEQIDAAKLPVEGATYESHELHEKNWLDAIRANDPMKANCNYELATKVQVIVSLAEMSSYWNKTMLFDEKTMKWSAG